MIGDVADILRRLYSVLPRGWFSDTPPVAEAALSALSAAWASVYDLISDVIGLTRLNTTTGLFLDAASSDYFGSDLRRKAGETDPSFGLRIRQEILRPRGTRSALQQALHDVTGRFPETFESARPNDTGGYAVGGVAYNQAGAWGNLQLRHCFFVTAYRPQGSGIAEVAGYGTGGPVVYGNLDMVATAVSDPDIYAAAAAVLPLGSLCWLRIAN